MKTFAFLTVLLSLSAFGSRYDAYVLDHLIAHHRETLSLTELAQESGNDPKLKREARKLRRTTNRELRALEKYREKELAEVPSYWILPDKDLEELKLTSPGAFDDSFLDALIDHLQEGRKRFSEAREKGSRGFVTATAQEELERLDRELRNLKELKKDL